jgi:hypothetical protein
VWIEISCRFISDDDSRIVYEGSSYRNSLFFSPRKFIDKSIFFDEKPHLFQSLWDFFRDIAITISTYFHRKCDIFIDWFWFEEFIVLENNSRIFSIGQEEFFCQVLIKKPSVIKHYISSLRRKVSNKGANECGFSFSRSPNKKHKLPRFDFYIYIFKDDFISKTQRNGVNFHTAKKNKKNTNIDSRVWKTREKANKLCSLLLQESIFVE